MTPDEQMKWGSHLPALVACVAVTEGPVLEFGVGHFSTPHLHAICAAMERPLFSVESNPEWLNKFMFLQSPMHQLVLVQNYSDFGQNMHFGVAFIDHSPGGKSRADEFHRLLLVSDYVIVHDYHLDNEEYIAPLLNPMGGIKYSITKNQEPPTLVASLIMNRPEFLKQL